MTRVIKFQVATNAVGPAGLVVACDLLPLEPVQGALILAPRDFTLRDTQEEIRWSFLLRPNCAEKG